MDKLYDKPAWGEPKSLSLTPRAAVIRLAGENNIQPFGLVARYQFIQ